MQAGSQASPVFGQRRLFEGWYDLPCLIDQTLNPFGVWLPIKTNRLHGGANDDADIATLDHVGIGRVNEMLEAQCLSWFQQAHLTFHGLPREFKIAGVGKVRTPGSRGQHNIVTADRRERLVIDAA